jgi:ribosomal-protein-alanine N-acetyltransferase
MKLETERLILKEINESHVEDILKIRSNEITNLYVKNSLRPIMMPWNLFCILKKTQDGKVAFGE